MMRIRIDGGQMTTEQLRAIAWASERFGRDVADVTDRQNVQLHWIRIEDVPAIFERLDAVGLTTQEACGDTPRVFLGCPLAGVTADEVLDADAADPRGGRALPGRSGVFEPAPQVQDLDQRLPRPLHEPRDQRRLVRRRASIRRSARVRPAGWRRSVDEPDVRAAPGRVRRADRVSRRLGRRDGALPGVRIPAFPESRAVQVPGEGLGGGEGPRGAREGVPRRLAACRRTRSGAPTARRARSRGRARTARRPGVRRGGAAGRSRRRAPAADGGRPRGCVRRRSGSPATAQQKLVIRDVDPARADELVAQLDELDLRARPNPFRKGTMACTGIEFCKLAIGETKGRAVWLTEELAATSAEVRRGGSGPRQRLPELVRAIPGRRHRTHVGAAAPFGRHPLRRVPRTPRWRDG